MYYTTIFNSIRNDLAFVFFDHLFKTTESHSDVCLNGCRFFFFFSIFFCFYPFKETSHQFATGKQLKVYLETFTLDSIIVLALMRSTKQYILSVFCTYYSQIIHPLLAGLADLLHVWPPSG